MSAASAQSGSDGGAPLVSIVTPCWNAAPYLREAYESLRRQTMPRWEWLAADDGSTDGSLALLRELAAADPRVVPIDGPHSGHPSVARNRAIARVRAPYAAFLDADDLWHPRKLERQLAFLDAHPRIDITYSFVEEFWSPECGRTDPPPTFWPRLRLPADPLPVLMARGNVLCTSGILMRRAALDALAGFDEDPDLRVGQDHDFVLRAARRFRIARTPGILVRYRLHPRNNTRRIAFRTTEALRRKLEERGELGGRPGRLFLSAYYLKRGERALVGLETADPRRDFLRALACDPRDPRRWIAAAMAVFLPGTLLPPAYRAAKRIQRRLRGKRASPHHLTGDI